MVVFLIDGASQDVVMVLTSAVVLFAYWVTHGMDVRDRARQADSLDSQKKALMFQNVPSNTVSSTEKKQWMLEGQVHRIRPSRSTSAETKYIHSGGATTFIFIVKGANAGSVNMRLPDPWNMAVNLTARHWRTKTLFGCQRHTS